MQLRVLGMSHVRGETPTRAGPVPVRKLLTALRRVTGRGARTRVALRGAVTRWSVSGESLRFRMVASQIGAPALPQRVAWKLGVATEFPAPGWSWISPVNAGRAYRCREARWQPATTTGILTLSKADVFAKVTNRYKRCEIRLECSGETGGLSRLFGGLSISRLRPRPDVAAQGVAVTSQAGDRGE